MTSLTVELPDEVYEDLTEVAKRLGQTTEEISQMAISLLMQSDSIDYAMIAMERAQDDQAPVELPSMDEDTELKIQFHPQALAELEQLDEDDQVDVLSELIERIVADEEDLESTTDLVINEDDNSQMVLSSFDFGDIVYKIADTITIYLIGMPELEEEMFDLLDDDEEGEEVEFEEEEEEEL